MNMAINSMLGSSVYQYNQLKGLSRKDVQGYIDEYKKAGETPVTETPEQSAKPEAAQPSAPKEINFSDLMESMTSSGRGSFARAMSRLDGMASLAGSFMGGASGVFGSLSGSGVSQSSPLTGVYDAISQNYSTMNYNANLFRAETQYAAQNSYQSGGSGIQGMFNQLLNVYA